MSHCYACNRKDIATIELSVFMNPILLFVALLTQTMLMLVNGYTMLQNIYLTLLTIRKHNRQKKHSQLMQLLVLQSRPKIKRLREERKYWVRPGRTDLWFQNILNNQSADEEWVENFRMSKASFNNLCEQLKDYLLKEMTPKYFANHCLWKRK